MSKPGFFFYTGDWIKDTRCVSLEARGAWIDLLCAMHEAGGRITWPLRAYDRYLGTIEREGVICSAREILDELASVTICDIVTEDNEYITVSCRRMVKKDKSAESNRKRQERFRAKRESNGPVTAPRNGSSSSSSSSSLNSYKNKNTQRPVVEASVSSDKISVQDFVDSWNATFAGKLPVVKLPLTESRKRRVSARLREHSDLVFWETVFTNIDKSRFLLGHSSNGSHPSWRCTFDFLITNDTNCVKIHEGSYNAKN